MSAATLHLHVIVVIPPCVSVVTHPWVREQIMVLKYFEVERRFAGLVIGPKGVNIKAIKCLPGIQDVSIDTKSLGNYCVLKIKASGESSFNNVKTFLRSKDSSLILREKIIERKQKPEGKIKKSIRFDKIYASKVIGPKGSGVEQLRSYDGISYIRINTELPGDACILDVSGNSEEACNNVLQNVQAKISKKVGKTSILAKIQQLYICHGSYDDILVLEKFGLKPRLVVPQSAEKIDFLYSLSCFQQSKTGYDSVKNFTKLLFENELVDDAKVIDAVFPFDESRLLKNIENILDIVKEGESKNFEISFIAGKINFKSFAKDKRNLSQKVELNCNDNGGLSEIYLQKKKLNPVYFTFLNPCLLQKLISNLQENGFTYINKDSLEMFTVVYLTYNGHENFTVNLAVNEDLTNYDQKDDPRLSKAKLFLVKRVLEATTIGEVFGDLPNQTNLGFFYHLTFRKLTAMLVPENNKHIGAKEAFEKLKHAYDSFKSGAGKDAAALQIDTPNFSLQEAEHKSMPVVVSVKSDKVKHGKLTLLSTNNLDLRASFTTWNKDITKLHSEIRTALNSSWEKRDKKGGIAINEGGSIYMECIKQVTARHVFTKVLVNTGSTSTYSLMEVALKQMRFKVKEFHEWKDCLEIDLKIIVDGKQDIQFDASEVLSHFLQIKSQWDKITKEI